jgi:predicted unusual protein kinase regulating ubiquinone biosynthesis (AarF/ABC1/UbiB family)
LVILDCGLAINLDGGIGDDLSRIVRVLRNALVCNTENDVGRELILLSERVGGRLEDVKDPETFAAGIGKLVREAKACAFKVSELNVGSLMGRSLVLGHTHRVRFDSRFVNLAVAAIVLQGVTLQLHPEGDLMSRMNPDHTQTQRLGNFVFDVCLRNLLHLQIDPS